MRWLNLKKLFLLAAVLISLAFLPGCNNRTEKLFFDTYTFEEVSYLSPASSSTVDYLNKIMAGSKYTITADLLKFKYFEATVEIDSPKYMKEEIPNESSPLFDVHAYFGDKVKYQYSIYDKAGKKTYWRLYLSSDCLWIATYNDNTANGSEIIMSIYKLVR